VCFSSQTLSRHVNGPPRPWLQLPSSFAFSSSSHRFALRTEQRRNIATNLSADTRKIDDLSRPDGGNVACSFTDEGLIGTPAVNNSIAGPPTAAVGHHPMRSANDSVE